MRSLVWLQDFIIIIIIIIIVARLFETIISATILLPRSLWRTEGYTPTNTTFEECTGRHRGKLEVALLNKS